MKALKLLVLLCVIAILSTSCGRTVTYIPVSLYAPPSNNVPLLYEKGDIAINLKSTVSDDRDDYYYAIVSSGYEEVITTDLQFAYALTDRWAVMLNTAFNEDLDLTSYRTVDEWTSEAHRMVDDIIIFANPARNFDRTYKYRDLELAVGYLMPHEDRKHLRVAFYGGLGMGKSLVGGHLARMVEDRNDLAVILNHHRGKYQKMLFQGNIGFVSKIVEIGTSFRTTHLRYQLEGMNANGLIHPDETKWLHLFEPSAFVRLGYKNVKVGMEYQRVQPLNQLDFHMNKNFISFNLFVRLNLLKNTAGEEWK